MRLRHWGSALAFSAGLLTALLCAQNPVGSDAPKFGAQSKLAEHPAGEHANSISPIHFLYWPIDFELDTCETPERHAPETMAGGVEGGIGSLTFNVLRPLIDHIALVTENEILEAVRWMLANHQYLIEPTAAVALAACLTGKIPISTQPTVIVITGRNVSAESVKKILCGF